MCPKCTKCYICNGGKDRTWLPVHCREPEAQRDAQCAKVAAPLRTEPMLLTSALSGWGLLHQPLPSSLSAQRPALRAGQMRTFAALWAKAAEGEGEEGSQLNPCQQGDGHEHPQKGFPEFSFQKIIIRPPAGGSRDKEIYK